MKMSPIKSKIPSGKVTHVIDPGNIWIQLCTREFQELDANIQESYINFYPNTQPGMVQAEQFVIAYSDIVKRWVRACVSRVMDTDVDLFYLDYGYAEQRPIKQISTEFEPRFSELPAQALHCRLHGIEPLAPPVWISRASKLLTNITSGKTFYVVFNSVSAGKHVVTLYDVKTQQNASQQLLEAEVCKLDGDVPFSESIHFDCSDLNNPKKGPLRVPSTDLSIFEMTSGVTPEKFMAFNQQQEYHRVQQEAKQMFAEHSSLHDQPLHSPETSGGFNAMKTMDEVLNNIHSQLQEMYNADKHPGNGNSGSGTNALHQTDAVKSSAPSKQSNRSNQGTSTGKKCTVPPGFRPLGCNNRYDFSAEDLPKDNYNNNIAAGKLTEDSSLQTQPLESTDNRLLGTINSVPVLATSSMFHAPDNQVCYPQEVEIPGCNPYLPGYSSSMSPPPSNSVLANFKRKLSRILPASSNVDWSMFSWQLDNLFHDFDGRMLKAEKLEVFFESVFERAVLNSVYLSSAISAVFLLKDKELFKESLAAVVKHIENSYIKVDSKDAEFCAVLLAHILIELAKQDMGCSTCLSPFQNIIFKWLKHNSMTCSSQKEKAWQLMYQECFVSFWSLAGGDCLLIMPQDFKEFLREEIHLMILKTDLSWSLRSRLLSVNMLQEQIAFYQERKSRTCNAATQTDAEQSLSGPATPLPVTMAPISGVGGSSSSSSINNVGSHAHPCDTNGDNIEIPDRWSPVSSPSPAAPADCRFSNNTSPLTTTVSVSEDPGSNYASSFPLSLPSEPTDICGEQIPVVSIAENNSSQRRQTPELISPSHFTSSLPCSPPPGLEPSHKMDDNVEAVPDFLWNKSINEFEFKKPIVEPMSWNPFEPDFLEKTLETAYVTPAKADEEELPTTFINNNILATQQPVQPVDTAPEMIRGSYAARVAEKACENQSATLHRNSYMFNYHCDKLPSSRTVFSSRDNSNAKIRFVAKRLVPEPSSSNSTKGKGQKNNGALSNSSSSSNSSCTSSPSSKIWNQPRQGSGTNISNIQSNADLSLDQIGKMLQTSEKNSWTVECKAPVASILTDNNHNVDMSLEAGDSRNTWSSRNKTHMMETKQSSIGVSPVITTCRQEAPTIHCTICGRDDHETHQCPDHSKSFFI